MIVDGMKMEVDTSAEVGIRVVIVTMADVGIIVIEGIISDMIEVKIVETKMVVEMVMVTMDETWYCGKCRQSWNLSLWSI